MSLRATINDALKDAMKAGDKRRISTLRLMNAAIKDKDINSRTDGHDSALTPDSGLIDLFGKMVKQRQESVAIYEQGGRSWRKPSARKSPSSNFTCQSSFLKMTPRPPSLRRLRKPAPPASRTWARSWPS